MADDFDPLAYSESQASAAPEAPAFDPLAYSEAVVKNPASRVKEQTPHQKAVTDSEITQGPIGFVNGLGEIVGKGIGNAPMAAVHGAMDIYSRATGQGPRPSSPTFPLSPNAQSVAQGVGDAVAQGAEPYRNPVADRVLNSDAVKNYVAPVAGDVAAIAPVAGVIGGVAGRLGPALDAAKIEKPVVTPQSVVDKSSEGQSMGAAAASKNISQASPDLQKAIVDASRKTGGAVNLDVLQRHWDADSHGVQLTKGQATRDPVQFSAEQNSTHPDIAKRLKEQNSQIVDAFDNIRRDASPTTVHNDPIQNGQTVVDSLKAYDEPIQADIRAKYKALTDANGGSVPIDTGSFLAKVDATLKKQYLTKSVPSAAAELLDSLRAGEPLDFEGFEAARTRLAEAQRAGGSEGEAARLIRNELEQMPLAPEAAKLKGLADTARSAAAARFRALEADPAYQAVVDDAASVKRGEPSPLADKFLDKYALGGPKANLDTMLGKLDPEGRGAVASHTLSAIKKSAVNASGNVLPNGYNTAMQKYGPKLDSLVAPETRESLESLGRVVTNAKVAPAGHHVNYSKSGVIVNAAQGAAEHALNAKTYGLYGLGKKVLTGDKLSKDALAPGAGLDNLTEKP